MRSHLPASSSVWRAGRLPARVALVALVLALLSSMVAPVDRAEAAYPGTNGALAFERGSDIWLVNPDGSGLRNLTATGSLYEKNPAISPDGNWVAFETGTTNPVVTPEIHVIRVDGSGRRTVAYPVGDLMEARNPTWSPDGAAIAFDGYHLTEEQQTIWAVPADGDGSRGVQLSQGMWAQHPAWSVSGEIVVAVSGQGLHALDPFSGATRAIYYGDPYLFAHPDVSPDGAQVVFECSDWPFACVVDMDGSNFRELNYPGVGEGGDAPRRRVTQPHFSPDGTMIAFSGDDPHGESGTNVYRLPVSGFNPDNSGTTPVTSGPADDFSPSWGPVASDEGPEPPEPPGPSEPPVPGSDIDQACPPGQVAASGFADVTGNAHRAAVDCIVWYGIAQGTSASSYSPANPVTRDQMASFLARSMEAAGVALPPPSSQGFRDVSGNTHEARINQLAELGLARGTTATTYSPRERVQRAQMATFLVRGFELASGTSLTASRDFFADDNGSPHEDNINKAAEAGFTTGTTATAFSPGAPVRRDQMGSFIARTLNQLVADGHMTAGP